MTPDNIKYLKERAAALGFELREAMIDDSFHFDLYHDKKKLLLKTPYPDVEMWIEGAEYEHERHVSADTPPIENAARKAALWQIDALAGRGRDRSVAAPQIAVQIANRAQVLIGLLPEDIPAPAVTVRAGLVVLTWVQDTMYHYFVEVDSAEYRVHWRDEEHTWDGFGSGPTLSKEDVMRLRSLLIRVEGGPGKSID
jgi:hypothetical protein